MEFGEPEEPVESSMYSMSKVCRVASGAKETRRFAVIRDVLAQMYLRSLMTKYGMNTHALICDDWHAVFESLHCISFAFRPLRLSLLFEPEHPRLKELESDWLWARAVRESCRSRYRVDD